jgi:hypothetical protein
MLINGELDYEKQKSFNFVVIIYFISDD